MPESNTTKGQGSSSPASTNKPLQPLTPKGGPLAGLPMKEILRRLQEEEAINGTLQNGGGGLAIIGARTPSKEPRTKPAEPGGDCKEPEAGNG